MTSPHPRTHWVGDGTVVRGPADIVEADHLTPAVEIETDTFRAVEAIVDGSDRYDSVADAVNDLLTDTLADPTIEEPAPR